MYWHTDVLTCTSRDKSDLSTFIKRSPILNTFSYNLQYDYFEESKFLWRTVIILKIYPKKCTIRIWSRSWRRGHTKINTARSERYSIMYNDIVDHCMHTCNNWNFLLSSCKLRSIIGAGTTNSITYQWSSLLSFVLEPF